MSRLRQRGGSFRGRMVLLSTLVAAVGLLGFALLALGFYRQELQKNLGDDLREALARTAPVIVRLSSAGPSLQESRFAGRVFGRLEEFGAEYASFRPGAGWTLSAGWPIDDRRLLERVAQRIPVDSFPSSGRGPVSAERNLRDTVDGREGFSGRGGVRILRSEDLPGGWIFAGVRAKEGIVLMAISKSAEQAKIRGLLMVFIFASPLALGLVALSAWLFSSRAIAPIRELGAVASATNAEDLSKRLSGSGWDREFRELVDVFNGMLDRLEKSFGQARRFGQDAAHELNTPLTLLTAKVDEAISEAKDGSVEQLRLVEVADELGRLREIVRKLHLLARIDGGGLRPDKRDTDVRAMICEIAEELGEAFPEVQYSVEGMDPFRLSCDPSLMRQILLNLLGNAGCYNRSGGLVGVELTRTNGQVRIAVTNTGPEIPVDFREAIFDRFTRADPSRGQQGHGKGLGLGLSLSREFARIQGGDLYLQSGDEDRICFVASFPA